MTELPAWFRWHQRSFPSANTALILGRGPTLVDSGFGHDAELTLRLLGEAGVRPARLSLIVNTHHHSDHVGDNHHLQSSFGVAIAST